MSLIAQGIGALIRTVQERMSKVRTQALSESSVKRVLARELQKGLDYLQNEGFIHKAVVDEEGHCVSAHCVVYAPLDQIELTIQVLPEPPGGFMEDNDCPLIPLSTVTA